MFSVIVPTLNCRDALPRTLESILAQQGATFEVLVHDGGSTDGTTEVLQSYRDSIRRSAGPDDGPFDAMNRCIDRARGTFAYFVGAGDLMRLGILAATAGLLPDKPRVVAYGNVYRHDQGKVYCGRTSRWKLAWRNVCQQSVFYSRSLFNHLGPFATDLGPQSDYLFNIRAFGDPSVTLVYLPLIIADYQGGGMSSLPPSRRFTKIRMAYTYRHLGAGPAICLLVKMLLRGIRRAAVPLH